ncbi:hypothetical protein FGO68_gene7107 [Halteria grandinella]|uniref:NFACT RNA-binding domain-containing protein n=1 Tax=Halteria grandinella TaxID=5974 RepID=A0A8J8NKL4_HALGN|nr:hypothetical protein FGO68_gene7107 [Halteria grandinella]
MVFFFESEDKEAIIYMGKDKFENETLIKYALPHDIWFHVDTMSSAHVYLRMKVPITSYDELLEKKSVEECTHLKKCIQECTQLKKCVQECAQLTKENSIEGCKKKGVPVIYTWASNLLKTDDMEVGAVSFKNHGMVKKLHVEKNNEILKKIQKTKTEAHPNKKEQEIKKRLELKAKQEEERLQKELSEAKKRQWEDYQVQNEELAQSNQDGDAADDFW